MGINQQQYVFAIDGGGSGCRVAIHNTQGDPLARVDGGPANVFSDPNSAIQNVLDAVQITARQAQLGPQALANSIAHIGLAGVIDQAIRDMVATKMPFARVSVSDDRKTSVVGAFGPYDGILAAIGTGAFVASQTDTAIRYFGGWGYQLSDQASGSWLGRQALKRTILAFDGVTAHSPLTRGMLQKFGGTPVGMVHFANTASPADLAALAPQVVAAAKDGDTHVIALMKGGVDYLMSCINAASLGPDTALCLSGGLGPHYAPYLPPTIQRRVQAARGTALDGAHTLARLHLTASGVN